MSPDADIAAIILVLGFLGFVLGYGGIFMGWW